MTAACRLAQATQKAFREPQWGMTHDDIQAVVAGFVKAAVRCKQAGADAVQIHAAHGYLLSEFLNSISTSALMHTAAI